jgi:polyisoprenoid-binding protein YceI
MPGTPTAFDASHGELLLHTGVSGRAAKLGHRLTLVVREWSVSASWADEVPAGVEFTANVDSLEVLRGDGGVKALSTPEKMLARANALRSLDAKRFPGITFHTNAIETSDDGYRLTGTMTVHGVARDCTVDLHVGEADDEWVASCETVLSQTDFGIKPYSMFMGAVTVADDVTVTLTARSAAA